jgi:hypothetical protein
MPISFYLLVAMTLVVSGVAVRFIIHSIEERPKMSLTLDSIEEEIDKIQTEVASATTVVEGASTLIASVIALIEGALKSAVPVTAVTAAVTARSVPLAAAVATSPTGLPAAGTKEATQAESSSK